ncbi:MAG TPA: RtcB family protein [Armatimonadota bacterium]|nr:RtcB family protein [Armatimonadota bacterium]
MSFREDMRVPARLYADEVIFENAFGDRSLEQLINTTTLPGVVRYSVAMPDIHQGYGPPIGAVIPIDPRNDGVISPGATGYDINCGVRLLRSQLVADELSPYMTSLVDQLYQAIPSGMGHSSSIKLSDDEMEGVLHDGAAWVIRHYSGDRNELACIEEHGALGDADATMVTSAAKKRGHDQLGTLGSGNHFVEVGKVQTIFDEKAAQQFGLFPEQVVVWIHTGSRGLGHQVCTDYLRLFLGALQTYGIVLPDRELVCAPFTSPEGQRYYAAMACAANFAWANRQMLTEHVRRTFAMVLQGKGMNPNLSLLYDVAHNIVKREKYHIDGNETELLIHRKGATRAFAAGSQAIPEVYRSTGQPVMVPGDMGTASYVLVGLPGAYEKTFGSACHGAGRALSRHEALREVSGPALQDRLRQQGVIVRGSWRGLAEEAPEAYKDVDRVVEVVHQAGIAAKVARVVPLGVIKG